MIFHGFNENVPVSGKTFHVQTQSLGLQNPLIVSIVFEGGAVKHSRKQTFADLLNQPNLEEVVTDRMRLQHTNVIAELQTGSLKNERISREDEAKLITEFLGRWAMED